MPTCETVTIDGTVYAVDRDVTDFNDDPDAPSRAICWLTARRGTRTLIVRDQIAHGAFVASGSTRLERTPSHRLREALETVFGPFPAVGKAADEPEVETDPPGRVVRVVEDPTQVVRLEVTPVQRGLLAAGLAASLRELADAIGAGGNDHDLRRVLGHTHGVVAELRAHILNAPVVKKKEGNA